MAEPVIVPVQLEVTDVDMSNVNFNDASKEISKSLSTVKKSIQDAQSTYSNLRMSTNANILRHESLDLRLY